MRKKLFLLTVLFLASFIFYKGAYAQTTTQCLALSSNLSYGMSDGAYSSFGPITSLQDYLKSAGYFFVTPNGNFGPATLSAVKSFQSAHGAPNTGYVGPLTRAVLVKSTCDQSNNNFGTSPSQTSIISGSSNSGVPTSDFIAPTAGQTLSTGQAFKIQWGTQAYPRYDLVLVSSNGSNMGFIAQGLSNTNQYIWNVGNVYTSQSGTNITVPNGLYQIRMQSSALGAESSDPVSNQFSISPATLSISSVFPAVAPADGNRAVVLYGSGFNTNVSVQIGSSGVRGTILYVSPDGTVLVFTVPTTAFIGSQTISVENQFQQLSNQLQFTVTAS